MNSTHSSPPKSPTLTFSPHPANDSVVLDRGVTGDGSEEVLYAVNPRLNRKRGGDDAGGGDSSPRRPMMMYKF